MNQKSNCKLLRMLLFVALINLVSATFAQTSSFTVNDSAQCLTGNSYLFTNTSTGSGNTYQWRFGDNTTSSAANPTKIYTTPGIYSVELKVTSGNIDYYSTRTISVDPMPVANFYSIASTQSGGSYTFISTSTISSGSMNYSWSFGDGTSSTNVNPTKNYFATGTYPVTLTVTSNGGCVSTTTQNVNVTLGGLLAAFNISSQTAQCLSSNNFTFNNQSSTGPGITYTWNFGSGATPATFTGTTPPTVNYSTTGTKTVTLTVNSASPVATAVSTQNVTISTNPTSSFTYTSVGNIFSFTSTSTGANSVNWLSNGNNIGSGNSLVYTFNTPGNYVIRLAAQNGNCIDTSAAQTIIVPIAPPTPAAPVAIFTVSSAVNQCLAGNDFTFSNTSTGAGNVYSWSFSNATPNTSSSLNPGTVVFNNAGTHAVTLTVTNGGGTSSTTRNIIVESKPTASFSHGNTGASYTFYNGSYVSGSSLASYDWSLNGVSFSTVQNPPAQILAAGANVVRLIVASTAGCRDTISQTITTAGPSASSFTISSAVSQCLTGNSFTFNNTSIGAGNTYVWNFPNATPSSSTSLNPGTVIFNGSGVQNVTLTVTNASGTFVSNQQVTVGAKPVASFSHGNTGASYTFYNGSYVSGSSLASYDWSLNGVSFSTVQNPPAQILAAGANVVRLIVASTAGCRDTISQTITTAGPSASSFTISSAVSQCLTGNSFTFSNTSTGAGNTYVWNFPNATPSSSTSLNPGTVTFNGSGVQNVTLTVTNASGTFVSNQQVTVGAKPVASFSQSNIGAAYTFFNGSYVSGSSLASYDWSLNGVSFSTVQNPPAQTLAAGVNVVRLIVVSTEGCRDTIAQSVTTAGPSASSFTITSPVNQCLTGNSFTFNNTSIGAGNTYVWNFPNATPSSSTSLNPGTVTFNGSGVQNVTLTVTNISGTFVSNQQVTVGAKPTASFSYSNGTSGYTFFNGSYVSNGTITGYDWQVDGVSVSTLQNPPVQSLLVGTRVVRLIAISDAGCRDTISQTITVTTVTPPSGAPVARMSITSANNQCLSGNAFTFDNTSTGTGNTYAWTFASGTPATSTAANPGSVTFATAGSHAVRLIATNANGADTTYQYAVVGNPITSFNTIPNSNSGLSFTFISTSTVPSGNMTYSWNFGDGSPVSTLISPTHTYATPGTYTVTLTVTGTNGCPASSATATVTSCARATAAFNVTSTTSQCLTGNSFTFSNASSNTAGTPASGMSYLWKFGDGTTSTLQNPLAKSYTAWGDYDVQLFTTVASGSCSHTDSVKILKAVSAEPMPVASYNLYLDTYLQATALYSDTVKRCFNSGLDFAYHSSSTVARGQMSIRKWSFETAAIRFREGDSVNYHNPRILFDTAGTYHVKHTITSDKGCKDSVIRVVRLSDPRSVFTADTIVVPNAYAAPQVVLANNSYDYGGRIVGYNWNFGGPGAAPTSSTAQNPTNVTYTCGGTKTLTLTITSDIGCTNTTTRNVVIKIKPRAGFTIGTSNYTPQVWNRPTITMTNTTNSVDACASYAYAWTFTNATPATSSATNPSIVFNASGTQTVGLLVTNTNGGKTDYVENTVLVAIRPRAQFTTSISAATPNATRLVTLDNTSTSLDMNPSATLALHTYSLTWGDGSPAVTGTGTPDLTHTYAAGGTYSVVLTMTNPVSGLTNTRTSSVIVAIKPLASFTDSAATYSPNVYAAPSYNKFDPSASTVSNDASGALSYSWNFGAGASPATSNSATPTGIVYTSSGSKTVTLIVTNTNGGLMDTTTRNLIVAITPRAAFTSTLNYNGDNYSNPDVNFTNTTTINDANASLTYNWNFGAGATPATHTGLTPPSVTYSSGGIKTIELTVTNSSGTLTTDTYTGTVNVLITPKARISVNNTVVAVPAPFGIGTTANYQSYIISAISNPDLAQQSSVATGSITSSLIEIDYTHIPSSTTVANWVSQSGAPYANVNFSIEDALKADYIFTIRLSVTSNLGVTDVTTITIANGVRSGGFTYRQNGNTNTTIPEVTVPPITRNTRTTSIVAATNAGNTLKGFVVYPNPTKDNVMVSFETSTTTKAVSIQLLDLSGKVVRVQKEQNNTGSKVMSTINVSNLPSGTYNVLLLDEKGRKLGTSKFIKAK